MTEKQFGNHECEPKYKATKTVIASKIIDLTCKGEKQKMLVVGFDGTEYVVKVQKPSAIPFILDDNRRKVTPFRTDDKETVPMKGRLNLILTIELNQNMQRNSGALSLRKRR